MKPTITINKDMTKEFNDIIKKFKNDAVLIGIPEEDTARKKTDDDSPQPITNAALLAINEFGSTANNIPPRPVMAIGIRRAQNEIAEQYKKAVINAFKVGLNALDIYYNRAGIIASNSVKKVINDQDGIDGPAEATLLARLRRKPTPFRGQKALIVTGQMRNAITYVVKGET
jgi:hypothetical protein